jgi:CubicO group peptidase (beta-lactamase class C family)
MGTMIDLDWDDLKARVTEVMMEEKIPGVQMGIWHKGETYTAGFGITNIDHPLEVTDTTLFQIGSISKTFTATAMMRLVELGKVELDALVRTYLPDFKVADETASAQATVRHLLTHMVGWEGDYFHDTGPGEDALPKYMADMVVLEQYVPVGTTWSYNNSAFYLAGYLIEVITEKSYQEALKELVLEPLGLKNCYLDPGDVITYRFAVGHEIEDKKVIVGRPWTIPRSLYAAGGIVTHVHDLLQYARFYIRGGVCEDGTRLLKEETITQMQSPQAPIWGYETCGISWFLRDVEGVRLIFHEGGVIGQVSLLMIAPDQDFAVAILTNSDMGEFATKEISLWALKECLGLEIKDPQPLKASVKDLEPYVGKYVRSYAEIELGLLGGRMIVQRIPKGGFPALDSPVPPPGPPFTVDLTEKDRMVILDGPAKGWTIDFIRKSDGSIGWMRYGYRIHPRENKTIP